MANNINITFKRFEAPRACGFYDQNNMISLIEAAFLKEDPTLMTFKPSAPSIFLFCAWDWSNGNLRQNRSRIFCDNFHFGAMKQKLLACTLTDLGASFSGVHGRTKTQHASGPKVGVSFFDVNGLGVDDYVRAILENPKHWLEALVPVG